MTITKENKQKPEDKNKNLKRYTWSKNLELEKHAKDKELIKKEAIKAVKQTGSSYFVNLVTHKKHDHPSNYLYKFLKEEFRNKIKIEYIDQCGCGGYVTRVHIKK